MRCCSGTSSWSGVVTTTAGEHEPLVLGVPSVMPEPCALGLSVRMVVFTRFARGLEDRSGGVIFVWGLGGSRGGWLGSEETSASTLIG